MIFGVIDALKAVAIVSVIAFHANFFPQGYLGVDLFFLCSGFLNYRSFSSIERKKLFSYFSSRRLKRFFVIQGIFLICVWCYGFLYFAPYEIKVLAKNSVWSSLFVFNLSLFDVNYFVSPEFLNMYLPLWSLSMEVQFLIVLFIVFRYFSSGVLFFLGFCSFVYFIIIPDLSYFDPLSRFWIFCLGCFLFRFVIESLRLIKIHLTMIGNFWSVLLLLTPVFRVMSFLSFYLSTRAFVLYLFHCFIIFGPGSLLSPVWSIGLVFLTSELVFQLADKRYLGRTVPFSG